jgi:hypothetical protein
LKRPSGARTAPHQQGTPQEKSLVGKRFKDVEVDVIVLREADHWDCLPDAALSFKNYMKYQPGWSHAGSHIIQLP